MSVAVQDIVDESCIAVTRIISVTGAFISVVLLMVAAVALWSISRSMLNRLAHYVTGNPAQVSAELESLCIRSSKLGVHKVFVQGGSGACGCKAYINEGAFDAALLTHQQFLGRNSLGVRFTSVSEDTTGVPEEPEAIRRARSALGDPRATGCFQGISPESKGFLFWFFFSQGPRWAEVPAADDLPVVPDSWTAQAP